MGSTRSLVLIHLDAAFNLARWLVQSESVAEEVVQEVCLRAVGSAGASPPGDGLPWVLWLVRSTAYQRVGQIWPSEEDAAGDDVTELPFVASEPLVRRADARVVASAISSLPIGAREILVLRDLEGMTYDDIATIMELPVQRVPMMLSSARTCFRRMLGRLAAGEVPRQGCGAAHPRSARTNSSSSCSFRSDTAQNDKPSRLQ